MPGHVETSRGQHEKGRMGIISSLEDNPEGKREILSMRRQIAGEEAGGQGSGD